MNLRALFAAGIAAAAIAAPVAATAVSAAAGTPAARPAALEGTPAPASMASIGGIVPALGTQVRHNVFAPAVNGCREPRCNLGYHRGPVMHAPRIYLVFWGPKWRTSGADYKYITRFYRGLGAPRDNWLKITTQYGDRGGHPRVTGSLVARIYMDRARPPRTVSPDTLAILATGVANRFRVNRANSDIVILSQSGTCFSDGFAGSCGHPHTPGYCGWHGAATNGVLVTNDPYQPDAGRLCGVNWLSSGGNSRYQGFSVVGGHEFAESITDPRPDSGWIDWNDVRITGGEIGDKCAWGEPVPGVFVPKGFVSLPTGRFAMQSLWSNKQRGCKMAS